jgi:hypothetical protein
MTRLELSAGRDYWPSADLKMVLVSGRLARLRMPNDRANDPFGMFREFGGNGGRV